MKTSDKALCLRASQGDKSALNELKNKHAGLVIIICREKLEAGNLHLKLSINYNEIIKDLSLIIWNELFEEAKKGIVFNNEHSFKNLLRKISTCRAVDIVRDSIKHRTQGAIQGRNNTFPRINKIPEDELNLFSSPETLFETEEKALKFLPLLLEQLDKKELEVIKIIQESIKEKDKKPTQVEMAEKLGITDRTIRSRMKSISDKAHEINVQFEN
jgi:DNA-directed RNA polymerase specialized sigma24 family protein